MKRLLFITVGAALMAIPTEAAKPKKLTEKARTIRSGELWFEDGKPVIRWRDEWKL